MKAFFDKYPELILMDSTYKLNNLRMPLCVMLCIGPNGESEIVAIFLTASEDVVALSEQLQQFKTRLVNQAPVVTSLWQYDFQHLQFRVVVQN